MSRRRVRARTFIRARWKAVAGGVGAAVTFIVTALFLAPGTQDTITAWAPEWLRPVVPLLFVVGTAWAVERTRNRPPTPTEE